jgi:hypothetical protein
MNKAFLMKLHQAMLVSSVSIMLFFAFIFLFIYSRWSFELVFAKQFMVRGLLARDDMFVAQVANIDILHKSLIFLNNAQRLHPQHQLSHRLRLKIYIALGRWKEAYNEALEIKSFTVRNPQFVPEVAIPLAYAVGEKMNCLSPLTAELQALYSLLPDASQLSLYGDDLLYQGQPVAAAGAYCAALITNRDSNKTPGAAFRDTAIAVMIQNPNAVLQVNKLQSNDSLFTIADASTAVSIPATSLRWLTPVLSPEITFGTPLVLPNIPPNNRGIGYFWGNGQAVAFVKINQDGLYAITAHVRHSVPAPVEMSMGIDGKLGVFSILERGDESWDTIEMQQELSPGLHTINIWFLNNEIVNDTDRDGAVSRLDIRLLN